MTHVAIDYLQRDKPPSPHRATTSPHAAKLVALQRDGFVMLHRFVPESEVSRLIEGMTGWAGASKTSRLRRGVVFAIRELLKCEMVQEFCRKPAVIELLQLIGSDLRPVRAILFDKTGLANWTVPWHQDRSIAVKERRDAAGFGPWSTKLGVVHVQPPLSILKRMVTLRLHLDACLEGNGPLRVIAGTHQSILDEKQVEQLSREREQTACVTQAGGLLVMRPLALHASSRALNATHRRILHLEFGPTRLPGGLAWAAEEPSKPSH